MRMISFRTTGTVASLGECFHSRSAIFYKREADNTQRRRLERAFSSSPRDAGVGRGPRRGASSPKVPPLPGPTAVELRSADFSPLPHGTRKCAGSGMNSALQVRSNSLNSMAVHPDPLPALCVPVLLQQRGERERERENAIFKEFCAGA